MFDEVKAFLVLEAKIISWFFGNILPFVKYKLGFVKLLDNSLGTNNHKFVVVIISLEFFPPSNLWNLYIFVICKEYESCFNLHLATFKSLYNVYYVSWREFFPFGKLKNFKLWKFYRMIEFAKTRSRPWISSLKLKSRITLHRLLLNQNPLFSGSVVPVCLKTLQKNWRIVTY